ncbi:GGDEF domain-containing protein [Bosea sp. SSUT16]|jgi:diguanylate cyclase (GGDEF)-like protein|uniref:diguanylate cyclase n=1 Tax=Bosea spartocytisi TaxID=2773451 RepID=A0A927EAL8_9HYPH|nr:GGDEF domain-containing protein [Bosea spartocytisi]MBD3845866.1 GGDEF domain-containing protein [Bosea spartocytisi]MCT4474652.1 GGDEF domain-containing protein [Bosea spartocytisi]
MYHEVHTENIAARAHAPEIAKLLDRFAFHGRNGRPVAYEDFIAEIMPAFGEDLVILEPTDDGDYRWIHYGREIVRYVGGSRLGETLAAMRPQVATFTRDCAERARSERKPLYTIHRSKPITRVALWERLLLPTIAQDGRDVVVAFSRPLQFREDLLNAVLDNSPSGIVALRAIRDDDGGIDRTVIVTANARAAELAGRPGACLLDCEGREGLPFLSDPTLWRRCLHAMQHQRADTFETAFALGERTTWLRLAVAPLGDGLLMTLTDITDLTVANQTLQLRAATLALEIGRERATRRALSEEIGYREEREKELRRLAETDPLTALLNRRSFTERAHAAMATGASEDADISLIIVDLDHFKQVNDSHGHAAGDAVIRAFADMLLGLLRGERHLVARVGGEEFAILLRGAGGTEAVAKTRQIQDALASRALPVSETLELKVTASYGIATRQSEEQLAMLMERADQALYRAKNEGRNRIGIAEASTIAAVAA